MQLKVGSRLRSAVCDTQLVITRAPTGQDIDLRCGGHPLMAMDAEPPDELKLDPSFSSGSPLGKRLMDADTGVEVLVTKPGAGSLAIDNRLLVLKEAKPLPASD